MPILLWTTIKENHVPLSSGRIHVTCREGLTQLTQRAPANGFGSAAKYYERIHAACSCTCALHRGSTSSLSHARYVLLAEISCHPACTPHLSVPVLSQSPHSGHIIGELAACHLAWGYSREDGGLHLRDHSSAMDRFKL